MSDPLTIIPSALRIALGVIIFLIGYELGHAIGGTDQRRADVVKVQSPYFFGIYHGKCAFIPANHERAEACTTTQ